MSGAAVQCEVCPHGCQLRVGQLGWCGVRVGRPSAVVPIARQAFVARGVGVVEDHPLFHFFPGMQTLCLGAVGCTAHCRYCQNWELALAPRIHPNWAAPPLFPDEATIVEEAQRRGCGALAFTYNEPTVWLEAILSLAQKARRAGLKVILVTNGYLTSTTLEALVPWLDAIKVDLKGADELFYREVVGIPLAPILATLEALRATPIWYEISTVILPTRHTETGASDCLIELLLRVAGADVPWHLQRFFPAYTMRQDEPGDLSELRAIRLRALQAGLRYVYISNVPDIAERATACPSCGQVAAPRRLGASRPLPRHCQGCGADFAGRGLSN